MKIELQAIAKYNNYFFVHLFVSLYCNGSFCDEAFGMVHYFYHINWRPLVECLQKQCILYRKLEKFTIDLQEFKIHATNSIL